MGSASGGVADIMVLYQLNRDTLVFLRRPLYRLPTYSRAHLSLLGPVHHRASRSTHFTLMSRNQLVAPSPYLCKHCIIWHLTESGCPVTLLLRLPKPNYRRVQPKLLVLLINNYPVRAAIPGMSSNAGP